jgi:ABC-type multidrug transport system ATPase subunit
VAAVGKALILLDPLGRARFQYSSFVDRAVSSAAVRVSGLVKRFGRREALGGVDLEVASGEAFGLLGANGAGKTTLVKCLLDFCAADAGSATLFGLQSRARARA